MSNFRARFPPKPPTKKSLFERQRAEAEAKRQREAAETAAVYEEFVKSFDDGGGENDKNDKNDKSKAPAAAAARPPLPPPMGGAAVGSAGGRRHFSMRSSLGSSIGSSGGGGGSTQKKRPFPFEGASARSRLAFGDDDDDDDEGGDEDVVDEDGDGVGDAADDAAAAASAADRAEERASAKPTIRLANLPPRTSPAAVRALVASGNSRLTIDRVRMLPTAGPAPAAERKAAAALVLLAANTAASDIDAAVSALQNRYLGFGHYLTLHRHLSSAVVGSAASTGGMAAAAAAASLGSGGGGGASQPFGARPVPLDNKTGGAGRGSNAFAPPPPAAFGYGGGGGGSSGRGRGGGRGIPPPPSLYHHGPPGPATLGAPGGGGPILHVPVRPPRNIRQLRMIHKTVERVLAHGPAFEALLMSRPAVQADERWAWLWDARSEGGVWYRYRLWETVTGGAGTAEGGDRRYVPLFEGASAWRTPGRHALPFEFATQVADLASDAAYDSSDASDEEEPREGGGGDGDGAAAAADDDDDRFLTPLDKARLTHLLARLPTTLGRARRGDLARVTAFALAHARRGADEVVDMVVANVVRPFAFTGANPAWKKPEQAEGAEGAEGDAPADPPDPSGAHLVAVYAVSDLLAASAASGVRHAWRYRQLVAAALRRRRVFAALGRLPARLRWGRLRADKWQRSVRLVLDLWDGWSVFPADAHAALVDSFLRPVVGEEKEQAQTGDPENTAGSAPPPAKSRWKTVDTTAAAADGAATAAAAVDDDADDHAEDADADPADDDDEWAYRSTYTDDEALDRACLDDEDIDGVPMDVGGSGDDSAYQAYLDGEPLTDEALAALGYNSSTAAAAAAAAEVSEEGEIGPDDDDDAYAPSGLSSLSSEGGRGRSRSRSRGRTSDVDMADAGATDPADKPEAPAEAQDAAAVRPRAKRMRAVDLFADTDGDGDGA